MDISNVISDNIAKLAEQYGLRLVLLFGSQATGLTHPRSDIDIGVMSHAPIDVMGSRTQLELDFQTIFGRADVEVVDLLTAPSLLQYEATQQGKVLYEIEPDVFNRFQIYAMKKYLETAPLRRIRDAALEEFMLVK